jgi:phage gp36-like protein
VSQYATLADLQIAGIPPAAFATLKEIQINGALINASAVADTYLRDRYNLPLAEPYDGALRMYVCHLATFELMALRGYDPETPGDAVIKTRYDNATNWLTRVAKGQATLAVVQTQPPSEQPMVITSPQRGFDALCGGDVNGSGNWL